MQISGSHPRATESDPVGVQAKLSRRFLGSKNLQVTGLIKCHSEPLFRYSTKRNRDIQSSNLLEQSCQTDLQVRTHWGEENIGLGAGSWVLIFQSLRVLISYCGTSLCTILSSLYLHFHLWLQLVGERQLNWPCSQGKERINQDKEPCQLPSFSLSP